MKTKYKFATHCATCEKPVEGEEFFTEVNPPGGYGRDQVLVCDDCLFSELWADYRAERARNKSP